ncbi:uncharacterized protein BXZ73DRAFT_95558 [Epithele typhae]|uniref:uncharacterized protein n=1 Tax=Epithele typhae TaxID=378194 RepID=UPI0020079DD3|nr:uncharacterized protein BXZ73DRAFT_95558 [Epithele typhae]KAH9946050.1 hypothetical protein BXZ73DRAFT_95558 [Epithele typhae]
MNPIPVLPPAPLAPMARPPPLIQQGRGVDSPPTLEVYLLHMRQEVVELLHAAPENRLRTEQHVIQLAERALARYPVLNMTALPPPLKQIDAYRKAPNTADSLTKYLEVFRAELGLDDLLHSDLDDKDGSGELSQDGDRDSDEDAIGSEHPKSPSLGPSASPGDTGGNTTVSSPEPRGTVSAPPQGHAAERKRAASATSHSVHSFTGDERCTNCIARNNSVCTVNSSRQRCDSCFIKRHRCSKVLTPPTRPTRETKSSSAKGKATDGAVNGESASARGPKRKRAAAEDDTKRIEPPKRPARPSRPAAATGSAAGTSASASAAAQRPSAPKKPPIQNGNGIASASALAGSSLAALAASASRAPRAPTAQTHGQGRQQYYQEKLQVISGILSMVQTAVKELQDQVNADSAAR